MYKTMEQIHEDYNGQWILMVNCKENEYHTTVGGEVVVHSESRATMLSKLNDYGDDDSIVYFGYAGNPPKRLHLL